MSDVEKLYEKLMKVKMSDLLNACSMALDSKMEEKRADVLFLALEARLQKRRLCIQLGMVDKNDKQ